MVEPRSKRSFVLATLFFAGTAAYADDWGKPWAQEVPLTHQTKETVRSRLTPDGRLEIERFDYVAATDQAKDKQGLGVWGTPMQYRYIEMRKITVTGMPGSYSRHASFFRSELGILSSRWASPRESLRYTQGTAHPAMNAFEPFVLSSADLSHQTTEVPIEDFADERGFLRNAIETALREKKIRQAQIDLAIRCTAPSELDFTSGRSSRNVDLYVRGKLQDPSIDAPIPTDEENTEALNRLYAVLVGALRAADPAHPATECKTVAAPLAAEPVRTSTTGVSDKAKDQVAPAGESGSSELGTSSLPVE